MGTQVALMMAASRLSEAALTASLLTFGLVSGFVVFLIVRSPRRLGGQIPKATARATGTEARPIEAS
jgi:hypothetical protein